jgi:hypothetical protein
MIPTKQNLSSIPTNDFQRNKIVISSYQPIPNETMIPILSVNNNNNNSIQNSKTPLTPMTPISSQIKANDGNKYNHIAQFQQKQYLLNKPSSFTTQQPILNNNNQLLNLQHQTTPQQLHNFNFITNRSNSFMNTYPVSTDKLLTNNYNNLIMTPNINLQNRNNLNINSLGSTSTQSLIYSTSLTNLSNLNTSNRNLFETEQDILDKDFLSLLENKSNDQTIKEIEPSPVSFSIGSNTIKKPTKNPLDSELKKKNTNDLIDLSINVNMIDEFDPLYEKKNYEFHNENNSHKICSLTETNSNNTKANNQESTKALSSSLPSSNNLSSIDLINNKRSYIKDNIFNDKTNLIERIDHFDLIDINISDLKDFQKFNKMVNGLKSKIDHEKKELSNLIVFTSLLESPISNKCGNIQLNIRYDSSQNINSISSSSVSSSRRHQFSLQVSLNATVETVVYNILMLLDINDYDTEKYLLKIHGLEEYLPINASLADLKYIHNCLIENKDPVLVLEELKNVNTDLSKNLIKNKDRFQFENFNQNSHFLPKELCENILKSIIQNRNLIEDKIQHDSLISNYSNHLDGILNSCINLKEKLKRLNDQIFKIGFESIVKSINNLEYIENLLKNHQTDRYDKNEKQPLIFDQEKNDNKNLDYYNDSIYKSNTDSNLQSIYKNLINTANQSIYNIYNFLNCCSFCFYWPFKLVPIINNEKIKIQKFNKLDIIQSDEKITVNFYGMSRLGYFLNKLPQNIK